MSGGKAVKGALDGAAPLDARGIITFGQDEDSGAVDALEPGRRRSRRQYVHKVVIEHHDYATQADSQREKDQIVSAAGKPFGVEDSSELIGCEIVAVATGSKVKFVEPLVRTPKPVVVEPAPILVAPTSAPQPEPPARVQPSIKHRPAQIFESDCVDDVVALLFIMDKDASELTCELSLKEDEDLRTLARITKACGLTEIDDTEELHRHPLIVHIDADGLIVDAEPNTRAIERRERDMAWVNKQQELGWPDDDEADDDEGQLDEAA